MPDEHLPATESPGVEPHALDESPNCDEADPSATDPSATDRSVREGPDRATDPPPDRADGGADREGDPGTRDGVDESDGPDAHERRLEHRLERLRLWRTVVTLAVVVARLIRSL
ncbi:hypothetical protein [Halorubrum sp. SD612]|uniref:hypothetical protein n=1 Tax=Halorubrum sp. SD612 TaxID=1855863 RepID=UPI000A2E7DEF|nr:hypothetical protein [Halorubrum sp. SD612]OTE98883.1 hypothetical protein B9G38_17180 [Halorubrum sp. SD612]